MPAQATSSDCSCMTDAVAEAMMEHTASGWSLEESPCTDTEELKDTEAEEAPARLGRREGRVDGVREGRIEGVSVGVALGIALGVTEGSDDGAFVGSTVGR